MKLTCQRDINELERIVHTTRQFFSENNVDDKLRMVVDLAIEELFVNSVKYNPDTTALIEIEFFRLDNGITVTIEDFDVERFDPTIQREVDVTAPAEERVPGGLGIYLTLKMVDSISYNYENRTSKITFTKYQESSSNVRN